MIYLLLTLAAVLVSVLRALRPPVEEGVAVRNALWSGGIGFLAIKLLSSGLLGPNGPFGIPAIPAPSVAVVLLLIWCGSTLVLWSGFSALVLNHVRRLELVWVIPFALVSLALGSRPEVHPLAAGLLALPAMFRARWRHELSAGTTSLVALVAFLLALLHFLPLQLAFPVTVTTRAVRDAAQFASWAQSIAVLYIFVFLPRLVWGMNVQIRSVKVRLLVSHLLMGLVPLLLVLIFWGLSTYLSVNGERAQIAARHLEEESHQLARVLQSATADADVSDLNVWAELEESSHQGLRVYRDGEAGFVRLRGAPLRGEEALSAWPEDAQQYGVILLVTDAYLAARQKVPMPSGGEDAIMVLLPIEVALGHNVERRIAAEAYLDTRWAFESDGAVSATFGADTTSGGGAALNHSRDTGAMGAAMVPTLGWNGSEWRPRQVLLWARVGFLRAVRGLASNLQENPFNLIPLLFLAGVAVLFFLVEFVTLGMVVSMGRSITRALTALLRGTARLREGNLRYRIPIEGRDDLWDVAENFNQMAVELEKARELEIEKERLEGELNLARQIQARLLPGETPVVPRTELAGLSVPARQVGGDYYDILTLPDGRLGLIIADVSGKGVPAALLMSSFRAALLSQRVEAHGPGETMSRLNRFLHRSVEPGRFVTAFLGVLDPETGELVYTNAGHDPPCWIRPDGLLSQLREGGLVLGLFGDSIYEQASVTLAAGDLLALFTDGVTEAQNEYEEFWGEERLAELLRTHAQKSCRRLMQDILEEVRSFAGEQGQSDDITLLFARWRGPA